MKKIKVGFIGAGGIVRSVHLPPAKAIPDVEVLAIADINKKAAEALAAAHNIPNVFESYDDMLNKVEFDAVVIGVPNFLHADTAIKSLKHGCHVLVEKPMAFSVSEAAKMVETAKSEDRFLAVGFNNRFRHESVILKKMAVNGEFGEIYYAKAGAIRRRGIPGITAGRNWFFTKSKSGGGALIDIGVHAMDLTLWFMGYPKPVSVLGSVYTKFGSRKDYSTNKTTDAPKIDNFDVDDLATAIIKFDNDSTLVLEASWASNIFTEKFYSQIMGTEGGADLAPIKVFKEKNGIQMDITPIISKQPIKSHGEQMKHFIVCIRNNIWKNNRGQVTVATAEQGYIVMQIIDAIYKSAETGREVKIK